MEDAFPCVNSSFSVTFSSYQRSYDNVTAGGSVLTNGCKNMQVNVSTSDSSSNYYINIHGYKPGSSYGSIIYSFTSGTNAVKNFDVSAYEKIEVSYGYSGSAASYEGRYTATLTFS